MAPAADLWRRSLRLFGFFAVALVGLLVSGWQDLRNTSGGEHAEITFILIGGTSALAFAIIFAFFLDYLIGPSQALLFAPFRVVVFSLVVGYGIATRKILEVGFFMRRAIAYLLLAAYLIALYVLVWWLCVSLLRSDTWQ